MKIEFMKTWGRKNYTDKQILDLVGPCICGKIPIRNVIVQDSTGKEYIVVVICGSKKCREYIKLKYC